QLFAGLARLVTGYGNFQTGRKTIFFQFLNDALNFVSRFNQVFARPFNYVEGNGWLAVHAGKVLLFLIPIHDFGNVGKENLVATCGTDHDIFDLIRINELTRNAEVAAHVTDADFSSRDVNVFTAYSALNIAER